MRKHLESKKSGVFIIFDMANPLNKRVGNHWQVWFENQNGIGRVYEIPVDKCKVHPRNGKLEVPAECLVIRG
jgi:hypothetical protein